MGLLDLIKKMKKTEKDARILVLGLDNAGKTTILKKLSNEEIKQIQPTQGFNVKSLVQEGFKLNVWDIGGHKTIRKYWENYFDATDALVYVVDSADSGRVKECQEVLQGLLVEPKLKGVPILVLANKQDLVMAMTSEEIVAQLNLEAIKERAWAIYACSALSGEGMQEGLEWLLTNLK